MNQEESEQYEVDGMKKGARNSYSYKTHVIILKLSFLPI